MVAGMSDYQHKRHNVSSLLYHIVCPAKYRLVIFDAEVDTVPLQRRLILTLCLFPDIYFYLLTTVPGGRGCYRRIGRQGSRLPFPSLHSPGVMLRRAWTNSVGSTPPFA